LFNDSHNDGKTSPLARICQSENIQPWEDATMHDFIAARLMNTSVSFTQEEIIQLVQESKGHPQKLMQLCYRTYARYVEGV
jgi:DNA polymerase III delta subunit